MLMLNISKYQKILLQEIGKKVKEELTKKICIVQLSDSKNYKIIIIKILFTE